jgi:L-aspartate oxidase
MERHSFDAVIIGSGISGLTAARQLAFGGKKVAVISKEKKLEETNTHYAQGGIVARGRDDDAGSLEKDIMVAGDAINNREAVRLIAEEGPDAVMDILVDWASVPFEKQEDGNWDFTKEAAHSVRRILHSMDTTGRAIEEAFLKKLTIEPNITFFPDHQAIDIITNTHNSLDNQERYRKPRCLGVYVYNGEDARVDIFFAPITIIAAGGTGDLFLHTSNPTGANGDGIAMAYRAGVEIINSEYVQFHPTILFHRDKKRFLISEAVRGEGARLKNREGEYFMERYAPKDKDLAPRDEVSRAIYSEMLNNGSDYVLLDTTKMKVDPEERFPQIYQTCASLGIDMKTEAVPVVPAAHYFCGGIKVDSHGRTCLEGLYAVGESACTGVHGANRLASVSLLEGLYFGKRAGDHGIAVDGRLTGQLKDSVPNWVFPKEQEEFDTILIHHDMLNIRMTMWDYVGIVRNKKRLVRALSDLNYLSHRIERFYKNSTLNKEIISLRNSVVTASIIAKAALKNNKSCGCHYRVN